MEDALHRAEAASLYLSFVLFAVHGVHHGAHVWRPAETAPPPSLWPPSLPVARFAEAAATLTLLPCLLLVFYLPANNFAVMIATGEAPDRGLAAGGDDGSYIWWTWTHWIFSYAIISVLEIAVLCAPPLRRHLVVVR